MVSALTIAPSTSVMGPPQPKSDELLAKAAEIQSKFGQPCRHDLVISDAAGAAPARGQAGANMTLPLEQSLNLGFSILKTPSHSPPTPPSPPPSKTPGSTWLMEYDGALWPAVLCDKSTTPPKFIATRHDVTHLPAILLGRRIYIWVIEKDLRSYYREYSREYLRNSQRFDTDDILPTDSKEVTNEKTRQRAFNTDAAMGKGQDFWMNVIEQRKGERETLRLRDQKDRRGQKRPRDRVKSDGVDHRDRKLFVHHSVAPRKKRAHHGHLSDQARSQRSVFDVTSSSDGDDDDDEGLFMSKEPVYALRQAEEAKKQKERAASEEQRRIQANYLQGLQNKKGICTIFVGKGESQTAFTVSNAALGQVHILTPLMRRSEGPDRQNDDTHIKLSETLDIKPADFEVITAYLNTGRFEPKIISGAHGQPTLDGVRTAADGDAAAFYIARAYHTASRLEIAPLQKRCVEKLRLLLQISAHALAFALTCFANERLYGARAAVEMEQWLVDRCSEGFFGLMKVCGDVFGKVLEENTHFRMSVFGRIAGLE